jgi:hypothetical protein
LQTRHRGDAITLDEFTVNLPFGACTQDGRQHVAYAA